MSIESLSIAFNHSRATGTARLVLYGIANHDGDGGAWPSIATLSRYAGGIDRRAIQRALTKLEELGEIERRVQAGGDHSTADHRRPNRYKFLLQCPPHCDRSSRHRDSRKPLVTFEDEELSTRAVVEPPRGQATARGAVVEPPEPSYEPAPRLKEESLDPNVRARADRDYCPTARDRTHHRPTADEPCSSCGLRSDQYWDTRAHEVRALPEAVHA